MKNSSLHVIFSPFFSVFGNVIKHSRLCLIYSLISITLFWIVLLFTKLTDMTIFILKVINSADQSQEDSTVLAFSSTSLNGLLRDFSQISYLYLGIGYLLMVRSWLLELINNSSNCNKGNHAGDKIFSTFFLRFFPGLNEFRLRIYIKDVLKSACDQDSTTPYGSSKIPTAVRGMVNTILSVWKCGKSRLLVLDILHRRLTITMILFIHSVLQFWLSLTLS